MFSKTKSSPVASTEVVNTAANNKKGTPSLISNGTHILGNVISDGMVDIDGSVDGNVKADQVTIRANGKITGDIIGNIVYIYGEVRGLVKAHGVHLYSSCNVSGVIVHHSLTVEDGAFIDAKFKRISDITSASSIDDTNDEGLIESEPSFVAAGTLRLIG